jgi:hypothetical protein
MFFIKRNWKTWVEHRFRDVNHRESKILLKFDKNQNHCPAKTGLKF